MGTAIFGQVPYGEDGIDAVEIAANLSFFDNWQDRYRYIIDLGKALPELPQSLKTEAHLVRGCQSQVWLHSEVCAGDRLRFAADSDAFIVRGLIAILFAAMNNKTKADILTADMEGWLDELGLRQHLSQARGNGLTAMVAQMRRIAEASN